jgi:hypothetical protein
MPEKVKAGKTLKNAIDKSNSRGNHQHPEETVYPFFVAIKEFD